MAPVGEKSDVFVGIQDGQSGCATSTPKHSGEKIVTTPKSLEELRPFPKAGSRKISTRGRKQGKCKVLTDTPEKKALEAEIAAKLKKNKTKKNALKQKSVQNAKKCLFGQTRIEGY